MSIGMTTAKLKSFIKQYSILPSITDTSTTADLKGLNSNAPQVPAITSSITAQGKTYSDTDTTTDQNNSTDPNAAQSSSASNTVPARDTELPQLSNMIQDIESALGTLNTARLNKYTALNNLQSVLNRKLSINEMSSQKVLSGGN
jgi:hypothetical protein